MGRYIKEVEVYKLGDTEQPEWLKEALESKKIIFERQRMIDIETMKTCENAIIGIRKGTTLYPIDSYIVYDKFKNTISLMYEYEFKNLGYKEIENIEIGKRRSGLTIEIALQLYDSIKNLPENKEFKIMNCGNYILLNKTDMCKLDEEV